MTASTASPLPTVNRQFTLAARPVGMPKESDFRLVEAPIPALANGQILLRTLFLSVDPYMRGRMTGVRTYADPVDIGQLMVGGTVAPEISSPATGAGRNMPSRTAKVCRSWTRASLPYPPRSACSVCRE